MHNELPKQYYFINKFDKKNIDKLKQNTGIIYRNYSKKLDKNEILELKNYCNKKKLKFFISNNIKLAYHLNLDGAYIPSFNNNFRHLNYQTKSNFIIIGSAHNIKEIRIKELKEFQNILKKRKIKFFLSNNIKLSIQLKLDGAYIPSFNNKISNNFFSKKKNFN